MAILGLVIPSTLEPLFAQQSYLKKIKIIFPFFLFVLHVSDLNILLIFITCNWLPSIVNLKAIFQEATELTIL